MEERETCRKEKKRGGRKEGRVACREDGRKEEEGGREKGRK